MYCPQKVGQKKSNFWGAVHLQSFSRENLKNSRIALNQHFQKFSLYGGISLLGQFKNWRFILSLLCPIFL